jgi:hypothetical protein
MKIGSLKEVFLTEAEEIFLFDCRVAGLDLETRNAYREVLTSFIHFAGDIMVEELTVDHVRLYFANLSDGPSEGDDHIRAVINHYAMIHSWVRWICAQKFLVERSYELSLIAHLSDLFPVPSSTKELAYCC